MSGRPGFAVFCNATGVIEDVLVDRGGHETPLGPGVSLADVVEPDSRGKFHEFIVHVRTDRAAFDWELNVRASGAVHAMRFSGVKSQFGCLVIGVSSAREVADLADEFIQMNSELLNTIRQLRKEAAERPAVSLSQLARMNNELTNLQRELAKRNAELERMTRFREAVLDTHPDVVYVFELDPPRITYVNGQVERALGCSRQSVLERGAIAVNPDDVAARNEATRRIRDAADGEVIVSEARLKCACGDWCWFRFHETVFARAADGTVTQVLGTAEDVTEERVMRERLQQLALVDELTGLSNRRGFSVLSEHALVQAERAGAEVGLVYVDVDGLKAVNDELGHAAGDEALKAVARLLRETMRASDVVARCGGDEFQVLAIGDPALDLEGLEARLRAAIDAFNASVERPYRLSVSIGAVRCDLAESCDLDDWVTRADARMYEEKARKKRP